jgi:hypothetical protein
MKEYRCALPVYRPERMQAGLHYRTYLASGNDFEYLPEMAGQNGEILIVGLRFNVRHLPAYRDLFFRIGNSMSLDLFRQILCLPSVETVADITNLGHSFYVWSDERNAYDIRRRPDEIYRLVTVGTLKNFAVFDRLLLS